MDAHHENANSAGQASRDQEIRYEAVPGYRPLFFVLLALAGAYLTYLFQAGSHG